MNKVIIIRGVSGSGKTTLSDEIMRQYLKDHRTSGFICSADDYFHRPDGTYDWNPKLLDKAHKWCFQQFYYSLENAWGIVIVDNTNIKRSHFQKYIDKALEFEYEVEEKIVGKFTDEAAEEYFKRNIHGVPLETIKRMMKDFES